MRCRMLGIGWVGALAVWAALSIAVGCGNSGPGPAPGPPAEEEAFEWNLPRGFPRPVVPDDNPMSVEKVALGRYLFYDKRLSGNGTVSCASCHPQASGFADPRARSEGATGDMTAHNAPGLANAMYFSTFTWSSRLLKTFEQQMPIPMFGEDPIEMGITGRDEEVLERLRSDALYQALFAEAFPDDDDPFNFDRVIKSIASFLRTMISGNSPWHRATYQGDSASLSDAARRGAELFFSERLECHHCHGGFHFTQATRHEGTVFEETSFHNIGLYNVDGAGAYPASDPGLFEFTGDPDDMGKFRAPSLQNVAVTAPYFHDGSAETLEDAIAHYEAGGRVIDDGPNAGDGSQSPLKSGFIRGFTLTNQDRADLIAFLESLTDESFLADPQFSDPFETTP